MVRKFLILVGVALMAACSSVGVPQSGETVSMNQQAVALRSLLNAERTSRGLTPLAPNAALQRAASGHATDMVARGYFSHTSPDGGTISDRARRAGYSWCLLSENISRGHENIGTAFTGWMNSSAHRANMLDANIRDFGLGVAPGGHYVLMMGRSAC